jgi:type IV secretion system protein VirD4
MGFWKNLFGGDRQPEAPESEAAPEVFVSAPRRKQAERRWRPPYLPPQSTTYGDARFADIRLDTVALKEVRGVGTGIWLGEGCGNLKADGHIWDVTYTGERHLLTVAPTGSGKGSCAIIPNLLMQHDLSIICVDPKGQNAAVTKRARALGGKPVYFLNPFNEHELGTAQYNPLAHLDIDSPNVVADVASLAEALIVTEGKDPHWSNSARGLVSTLMLHLIETEGRKATLPMMRALLTQDEKGFLTTIVEMSESKYSFIAQPARRFKDATDEIKNIKSTAITQTAFLDDPAIAHVLSASKFNMSDFKMMPCTLYIILPSRHIAAYSRFFRLIVVSALDQLTSVPGGVRTLFMLDEFAQLGHLSAIENAFGLARGYNIQLWPFVQDLNQLKDLYKDRWQTFVANAGIVQWFAPNDTFTAEYLSKRIGKTTVTTTSLNTSSSFGESKGPGGPGMSGNQSRSENTSEVGVDFMPPQALFDLPDHLQILTLVNVKYPILAYRDHYYEWGGPLVDYLKFCDPDPFHGGTKNYAIRVAIQPHLEDEPGLTLDAKIAGTDEAPHLEILPEKEPENIVIASVDWKEPVRMRSKAGESIAILDRNLDLTTSDDYGCVLVRYCPTQMEKFMLMVLPPSEVVAVDIRTVGEISIPPEYKILRDQVWNPDDLAICLMTNELFWPLTMTCAPREQVQALLDVIRKRLITKSQRYAKR